MSSANDRFALQLQTLSTLQEKVLVVADLLERRSPGQRFRPAEIATAFYDLSVPPPTNTSNDLRRLAQKGFALKHPDSTWSLTPQGRLALGQLSVDRSDAAKGALSGVPSAEFAYVDHTVIPHWAAPPRWAPGIKRLVEHHPFDTNVFGMTRFPQEGGVSDPVAAAIDAARETLARYGLTLHMATDSIVDDDLFGNVGAYMWGCRYGLGFIEDRVAKGLNYNAVIELGGMAFAGRRCAILKDRTVPNLPTDLSGHIYRSVDLDDPGTIRSEVAAWASNDLGFTA